MDARKKNLFTAISEKKMDELKKIEAEGIDLTWTNDDNKTPVEAATLIRWTEGVKLLAKKPAEKNDNEQSSARYGSALYYAVEAEQPDLVQYLLSQNSHLGWHSITNKDGLLHIAIRKNNKEIFKLLIKTEINLVWENNDKQTPLALALSLRTWEFAEMLFDAKPNPTINKKEGGAYLLTATKDKQHRLIKALLQASVSVSATTENDKESCLHLAARNNDSTALKLLLDTTIDKTLLTKDCKTTIELACELGHWTCAQEIIEKDLKNSDSVNQTYLEKMHYVEALYLAIKKGNYAIVNLLLKLNVSCMKEDTEMGNTAIYYACKINNKDILSLLLQKIDLKKVNTNKDNKTPFDIAKKLNATECYPLLIQDLSKTTDKNAELVDLCETYLRNLELNISLTPFKKQHTLFGLVYPPPIESIKVIFTTMDYSNRKSVWDNFIKITALFKSHHPTVEQDLITTNFILAQLTKITEILELSEQQYIQTKNQVTNRIMSTNAPYYSNIQSVSPPTYEQAVTRSTTQPLIPAPSFSYLTATAVQPVVETNFLSSSSAVVQNPPATPKEMQPLPNVSYAALADLSMFQNNSSPTNNSSTTVLPGNNPFIPPPPGM